MLLGVFLLTSSIGCGVDSKKAIAYLRIKPTTADIGPREDYSSEESFFQTQMQLLTTPIVLARALNESRKYGEEQPVQTGTDSLEDLKRGLTVTRLDESEIVSVSYSGRNPEESAKVLDAVLNAYLQEVVEMDIRRHREYLFQLERAYADRREIYARTLEEFRRLQGDSGSSNPDAALIDATERERMVALSKRIENLRDELLLGQIELATLESLAEDLTPEQSVSKKVASARVNAISGALAKLESESDERIRQKDTNSMRLGNSSISAAKNVELEVLEQGLKELGMKIEVVRLQTELQSPLVMLLSRASVSTID